MSHRAGVQTTLRTLGLEKVAWVDGPPSQRPNAFEQGIANKVVGTGVAALGASVLGRGSPALGGLASRSAMPPRWQNPLPKYAPPGMYNGPRPTFRQAALKGLDAAKEGLDALRKHPRTQRLATRLSQLPKWVDQNLSAAAFGTISGVREYNQQRATGASVPRALASGLSDAATRFARMRAGPGGVVGILGDEYRSHGPLYDLGGADSKIRSLFGTGVGGEIGTKIRDYMSR